MDEEEKPPQEGASDKTVIAPPPTERPQAGAARTRTVERKLQPALDPEVAARTRDAETRIQPIPQPPMAPARTNTAERKAVAAEEPAVAAPARTRTTERKAVTPEEPAAPARPRKSAPSEEPARTRTTERKLSTSPEAQPAPPRTRSGEVKAVARPAPSPVPAKQDEPAPITAPVTLPRTRSGEVRAVARSASALVRPDEDESAPITAPTTLPEADALSEDAPAQSTLPGAPPSARASVAGKAREPSPMATLPGAPVEHDEDSQDEDSQDEPPPVAADRTVMTHYPEPPSAEEESVAGSDVPSTGEWVAPVNPQKRPTLEEPAEGVPPTDEWVALANTQQRVSARTTAAPEDTQDEAPSQPSTDVLLVPGTKLGGYQLIERLGAGAMGTVWLARQLSLDRDVAVKVLRPGFSGDPLFLYRFTQEAFAAAQLIHHNIVQVYDCGSEKQIHFFSMEYVDAQNLQSLVKRGGPLDSEVAAGYVLQAARGLKFAHERGMVHRDIKPDNLLLNHNGVVKVADLGLVKLKRSAEGKGKKSGPVTYIGKNPQEYAMGTPAYMAPEQVANSARVDARADIYALGCTLYHLITGRPPFIADTITKVMDMHVQEQPVRPDGRNPRVSQVLSDIVMKMMAKSLDERYQDMDEVIKALEGYLGIEATSTFSPREEHANLLESCVKEYNQSPWAKRRRIAVLGLTLLSAVGTGVADRFLGPMAGLGVAAFTFFTWMSSFILRGLMEKGSLFLRFRQFVFQAPLVTWLIWVLLLGGAGYGLYHLQLLWPALALMGGALVFAVGFYLLVDRNVEIERKPPVLQVEQMLRSMRLRGLEESALRQFVCKYSGESWEAFFEALFGYDAKILARRKWGLNDRGLPRLQHSTWRDPLIRAMEAMQTARKNRRERRQLKLLERKKLKAQAEAKAKAEAEAAPEPE